MRSCECIIKCILPQVALCDKVNLTDIRQNWRPFRRRWRAGQWKAARIAARRLLQPGV